MDYKLKGKLEVIGDTQQVSDTFKKRELVVLVEDDNPQYNQSIKLQLAQAKCDLLNSFKVGDDVEVSFNLRGRPYTKDGKTTYFTNLDAWRIQADNGAVQTQELATQEATEDDLPF